ncbi:unnamed protein product [Oikopleura dioica]|uniref:Uncharacterized protein n=1 Tax=Oikopleura dioica TaxID=34765 RepID=E4X920_OIKDI|nr:unnamed protein product [Oikopleura dioica]
MSARKSSRLARMRDNLRDTEKTPKKADSSMVKLPVLEKKKTISESIPVPRKTRSSAVLSQQSKSSSICDVESTEVQLQYRSSMYDKIKGGKRVIKPNPGNLSFAKTAFKKTIPKKEEDARDFSLRSKTDANKEKSKELFKAPERKATMRIKKSKGRAEEVQENEESKNDNKSKVKKEKRVKNEHENSEEVLILVDEEDPDEDSSVSLLPDSVIEREQKKEDMEVDGENPKETAKEPQATLEDEKEYSKVILETKTTSHVQKLKRKSSIPDFFKPLSLLHSHEQVATPAKKAKKDGGQESSASDSSRPESECPPVEPPFVKGLETPTIVVDSSNGPITIDDTSCAEKRRLSHKVKSLKKSRNEAAERRRERLKNTNYWSKEAQIIKGKERPGWSKVKEPAKSNISTQTPKRSFSPRNDTSFTPVQREVSRTISSPSVSTFLSPLSVPAPGHSVTSSPLATPLAQSPAKPPVTFQETFSTLSSQVEPQAVHRVICQPERISISSDDETDRPVFVPAPIEQPDKDDVSSTSFESDEEQSEIEPANDYERGMIAIREKHRIVVVSDDEEDRTLPLYNLDFKERRDALSFACFADWLTTSPLVRTAVENWQRNNPEDCRRLGNEVFVNSYQPKDLPWRQCKKKESLEMAQIASKQVDHVTGNEIQV